MGVTSCLEICSKNENEFVNPFSEIKKQEEANKKGENNKEENNILNNSDNDINNINEEQLKEDYKFKAFKNKFETVLPNFGQYIDKEQFNENIPENVRSYMDQNEFQLPDNLHINENIYEMPPIKFKNDNLYEGYWNENIIMDGLGKYYIADGNLFIEGVWDNGRSIYGRIYYPNNNIYEGYITNSYCQGKGKLFFSTGEIYEGDFVNGEIDGNGKFTFADKTTYEGQFSKGDFHGHIRRINYTCGRR
jgi:hypothetical protein